jgi:hypothetical protein
MDNEDFMAGLIAGFGVAILCLSIIFACVAGTFSAGYKQAYIDMKHGKIEAYMIDHYHKVWVEQNINKTDYLHKRTPEIE